MAQNDETRHMNDTTMPPPKIVPRKQTESRPERREKIASRKGFGLSDWNRLLKSSNDLAQTKGMGPQRFTMEEIQKHNTVYDGWVVLRGKVYNLSPYLPYHPGGERILKGVLGKDGTALYDKYHRWVNQDGLIGKLHIGYLEKSSKTSSDSSASYLPQKMTNDGFAIPAPPKSQRVRHTTPSILSSNEKSNDEADEVVNPWETK